MKTTTTTTTMEAKKIASEIIKDVNAHCYEIENEDDIALIVERYNEDNKEQYQYREQTKKILKKYYKINK